MFEFACNPDRTPARIRSVPGGGFAGHRLVLVLLAVISNPVLSQEDEGQTGGSVLEEITVTGSRTDSRLKDVTTSVSIVREADLQTQLSLGSNVLKALDVTVPGLNVATRDTRQAGCSSTIRGRNPSFQINGIPVNQDLRRSNCNGMFQVSPFALERIEVVRGSTALYGAGAPGGIVNLITRRAHSEELEIDSVVQFGLNPQKAEDTDEYTVYLGAGQAAGNWDYYAGLGYHDADAVRNADGSYAMGTARDDVSLSGTIGYEFQGFGRLRLTGTYYREDLGTQYWPDGNQFFGVSNVVVIEDHPDRDDAIDQLLTLGATLEIDEIAGHRLTISAYLQDQDYKQRDNFFDVNFDPADFFLATDTENERHGLRSTLDKTVALSATELDLEYGFDYSHQRFYRPTIDTENNDAIIDFIAPETMLDTYALFAQAGVDIGRWRLTGGIRHEMYRGEAGDEGYDPAIPSAATPGDFDDDKLWLGNAGVIFNLTDAFQLYAGFSQGAELSELSRAARGVTDPGLVSLEPATSDQYEIGGRGSYGSLDLSLAVFYSQSDKSAQLQADPSCAGEAVCPLIPLRVEQEVNGVEATMDWNVSDRLALGFVVTHQEGKIFDQDLGRFVDFNTEVISPTRVTGYIEVEPVAGWRNRLQAIYTGEIDQFTPTEQGIGRLNTESTFLADYSSSYDVGPGAITISISNLFNEDYINATNQGRSFGFFAVKEEGRRVTLGYRSRF